MNRREIIFEALALIDVQIAIVKEKQKQLRAEGGYRHSATDMQYRKTDGLRSERYAYEKIRSQISFLQWRPKGKSSLLVDELASKVLG